jgi:two-component system NtrC family response regulator
MKPSVLIVDDEEVICTGLERLLSKDYTTYKAFNAKEAIDLIKEKGNIDVILCDLKMPGMDGTDMIEKIRSADRDIFMIVITAASPKRLCKAMKVGANNFLTKPIDIDQLERLIKNATRLNEANGGRIVCN